MTTFRNSLLALAMVSATALGACTNTGTTALEPRRTDPILTGRKLSDADLDFITYGTQLVLFDDATGKLAAERASDPEVRAYAEHIRDLANSYTTRTRSLVESAGSTVPTRLNAELRVRLDVMGGLSGAAFDQRYLTDQIFSHQVTIKVFQRELAEGTDQPSKDFARETLPVVQQGLEQAQALQARLSRRR